MGQVLGPALLSLNPPQTQPWDLYSLKPRYLTRLPANCTNTSRAATDMLLPMCPFNMSLITCSQLIYTGMLSQRQRHVWPFLTFPNQCTDRTMITSRGALWKLLENLIPKRTPLLGSIALALWTWILDSPSSFNYYLHHWASSNTSYS